VLPVGSEMGLQPVLLTRLGIAGHGASRSECLLADGRTGVGEASRERRSDRRVMRCLGRAMK